MVDKSARGLSNLADTSPQLKQTNKHCNMLDWPYCSLAMVTVSSSIYSVCCLINKMLNGMIDNS